jgi:hypothetical protein
MQKLANDGIAQVDAGLQTIQTQMDTTGLSADNFEERMASAANEV